LKVAILEIGCGYNVPTCRRTAEILLLKLSMRGADASLIRINLSHPEPDDDDIEDSVISIMEKGFVALKLIDARYRELVELNSSSQISNDEKSDANDARNFTTRPLLRTYPFEASLEEKYKLADLDLDVIFQPHTHHRLSASSCLWHLHK
jgi:hypothetical protein